jgi:hypothetical protein
LDRSTTSESHGSRLNKGLNEVSHRMSVKIRFEISCPERDGIG